MSSYWEVCPVCGNDEDEHLEVWTDAHSLVCQYQPSLHRLDDFYRIACDEVLYAAGAPAEGVAEVEGVIAEDWTDWGHEVLQDVVAKYLPEGYAVVSDEDYWSIWQV